MAESVKHRIFIGNDSNPLDVAELVVIEGDFTADSTVITADSENKTADEDISTPAPPPPPPPDPGDPEPEPETIPVKANDVRVYLFKGGTVDVNVLYNDLFENPVAVSIEVPPVHGSVAVQPDKMVRYVHDGINLTSDYFIYKIDDGTTNDVARVNITIQTQIKPAPPDGENADAVRSFNMSNNGYYNAQSNGEGACQFAQRDVKYHNGASESPVIGDKVYLDRNGLDLFNGNGRYWAISNGRTIKIDSGGVVLDVWICGNGNA